jgi:hypothetical protein
MQKRMSGRISFTSRSHTFRKLEVSLDDDKCWEGGGGGEGTCADYAANEE